MKTIDEYNSKRTSFLNLREKFNEIKERQINWEKAISDLKQVEKEYFFPSGEGIIPIRKEIDRLSQSSGLEVNNIRYSLREIGEGISLYELDFLIRGNYFNFTKFLDAVENKDIFVMINKLNFSNISQDELEIKIKLYAYLK
ncbi:MAG: type 4a pilus biogenesis protein PilO [Acidobacteriota bacterium]